MNYKINDLVQIRNCANKVISNQAGRVYEIRDDGSMLVRLTEVGFPMMVIVEENDIEKI